MNRSQPILPIRFYSDVYDQDRFNLFHKKLISSNLNYPPNQLPSFQAQRPVGLSTITAFTLRNICNEPADDYKIIPEQASNFGEPGASDFFGVIKSSTYYDNGVDPPEGRLNVPIAEYSCGKLMSIAIPYQVTTSPFGALTISTSLTNYYSLKVIIDKLQKVGGSDFSIKVKNGTTLLDQITKPGVYNYYFLSNGSDTTVEFDLFEDGDEFSVSYIQCSIEPVTSLFLSDVQLDHTDLDLITTTNNVDVISWCDNNQNYNVSPGSYYYIIQFSDGSYLFSEVFSVKSYKEIENFYKLTWWNSVDINGQVIYNETTLPCGFRNNLFIDASLFEPEYDTTTENVKNGENDDIPIFNKWQKSIKFQIVKAPEFLADSLSAIFLHDNVFLTPPLNWKQEKQSDPFQVLKVTSEINPVLDDCYQKVELKLLLEDKYTKVNCEEGVTEITCDDYYKYKVSSNPLNADYYATITGPPTAGDGIYRHSDNELIEPLIDDIIFDFDSGEYYTMYLSSGIWQKYKILPKILLAFIFADDINILGTAIPNTFIKVQYNKDSGGWIDSLSFPVDEDGNFNVQIPESLSTGATDFDLRVQNKTRSCTFATSDIHDLI